LFIPVIRNGIEGIYSSVREALSNTFDLEEDVRELLVPLLLGLRGLVDISAFGWSLKGFQ
jgi:hypothetical protein